jgi:hypothetical protein
VRRPIQLGSGRRKHLVDTTPVEIDDFETPPVSIDVLADIRDSAEFLQQETGNGPILPGGRKRDLEQFGKFDGRHPAGDQIGPVVTFHSRRFSRPAWSQRPSQAMMCLQEIARKRCVAGQYSRSNRLVYP